MLGVLPFTGVPVPLISYGGTSLSRRSPRSASCCPSARTAGRRCGPPSRLARRRASPRSAAPPRDLRRQRARPRPARRARGAAGRCDAAPRAHRGRRHRRARDARAGGGRGVALARRGGDVRRDARPRRGRARARRAATRSTRSRSRASRASPRSAPSARSLGCRGAGRLRAHPAPPPPARGARRRRLRRRADAGGRARAAHPGVLTEADAHLGLANRLAAPLAAASSLPTRCPGGAAALPRSSGAQWRARFFETTRAEARAELELAGGRVRARRLRGARRRAAPQRRVPPRPTATARGRRRPPRHRCARPRARVASRQAPPDRYRIVASTDRFDGAGGRRPVHQPRRRHGLGARGSGPAGPPRTVSLCDGRPSAGQRGALRRAPAER